MNKKKGLLSPDIKAILIPGALLVIIGILIVITVNYSYGRITQQRQDVAAAKITETVLTEKATELENTESLLPGYVRTVSSSIPEKSPILNMLLITKLLAIEKEVFLEDISLSSVGAKGLDVGRAVLRIDATGETDKVISFTKEIKTYSPMSTINDLSMEIADDTTTATITITGFYSDFPKELPDIEMPIDKLTSDDYEIIRGLSLLNEPPISYLNPTDTPPRENPFSL